MPRGVMGAGGLSPPFRKQTVASSTCLRECVASSLLGLTPRNRNCGLKLPVEPDGALMRGANRLLYEGDRPPCQLRYVHRFLASFGSIRCGR